MTGSKQTAEKHSNKTGSVQNMTGIEQREKGRELAQGLEERQQAGK